MSYDAYLVFDIETAANDRAPAYYKGKRYDAPANFKDPAKIEAAILEKQHKDMESAALSWWTGRVLCVSATPVNGGNALIGATFYDKDERRVLSQFFDYLTETARACKNIILVGKASESFDVPFLIGRAIALDMGLPDCLRQHGAIRDVDKIFGWSSSQSTQRGRLSDYAWGMSHTGKLGDGAGVASMWLDIQMGLPGAWDRLTAYCRQDVAITAELLRRYLKFYIPTELPKEEKLEIPFG